MDYSLKEGGLMKASGILNYITAFGGNMKDSKIRYGVYALLIWNCIIAINIILRSNLIDDPLDLSSVGIKLFFMLWSLIMFGVGYYSRRDYLIKENLFIEKFKDLPKEDIKSLFKIEYYANILKMLFYVFVGAIPWLIIGYWTETNQQILYTISLVFIILALLFITCHCLLNKRSKNKFNKIKQSMQ